jgi:hypothetical protein
MFRLLIVLFMTSGIGSLARAESTAYVIDTEHSSLAFEVPHLVSAQWKVASKSSRDISPGMKRP